SLILAPVGGPITAGAIKLGAVGLRAAAPALRTTKTITTTTTAAKYSDDLADACRTNSFTATTPVLMADGSRKPITEVKLGDWVMATDPETGEAGPRKVVDLIRHGGLHTMVAVRLADGSAIESTDQHRFWVESRREWVGAIALQPGDIVVGADGDRLTVTRLGISEQDLTVYNLTVEGLHTYFVGAESVLVHNCIRNSHLAGSTHPTSGVPFDDAGFPNFSAWRHPEVSDVRIQLTGSRSKDFRLANEAAGLARTPTGYTWHHHQDTGLMQLIRADIHRTTGHTGGFSMR
ncbi:MAG: polymorphic toxin-type HINT domain-containing protein, partial [Actinomycetales bacterium]